jgi:hypothetical protein
MVASAEDDCFFCIQNQQKFKNVMKFTKEQAAEQLKASLTEGGKKPLRMTERSLGTQVDTLLAMIGTEEMELDDFCQKVLPTFVTMNGNAEYDKALFEKSKQEEIEKFKKTYKQEPPKADEGYNALLEKISKIEEALHKNEIDVARATKAKELRKKMKESGIDHEDWIDKQIGLLPIDENTDVNTLSSSLLEVYNAFNSTIPDPITPKRSDGAGSGKDSKLDSIAELRKKEVEKQNQKRN